MIPTDEDFRAAGFTAAARDYPLSHAATDWLAAYNGVPLERLPAAWRYAPNADMRAWIEWMAALPRSETIGVERLPIMPPECQA